MLALRVETTQVHRRASHNFASSPKLEVKSVRAAVLQVLQ
jgi:hypothetical protein